MCFDFKIRQSYAHIWSLNREFWWSLEDLIATVKTDADLLGKTVAAVCSWSKTFLLKLGETACQGPDMGPCATVGPRESQGKTKGKPSLSGNQRIELNCHSTISRWCLHLFHLISTSVWHRFAWLHVEFKNSVDANPQTLPVWSGLGLDLYNTEKGEDVACPDLQAPHECGECWSWGTDVKDVGRMPEHLSGKNIKDNSSDIWWYRPTWFQVCNWSTKETGADGRVYLPSLASRQLLRKRHHHLQFVWYPIPSRSFLDRKSGYGKDGVERSYQWLAILSIYDVSVWQLQWSFGTGHEFWKRSTWSWRQF